MSGKFLGRYLDHRDMTWKYRDGSGGAIPDECRTEMFMEEGTGEESWLRAYRKLLAYKKRLGL